MKKILKIAFYIFSVLVVLIVGALIYLNSSGLPTYDVRKVDLQVDVTPERIANGKRLSLMICSHCHFNSETRTLSGTHMKDLPDEFGVVHSKNITNDPEYGIGNWTDGEIYFLLRTGINPRRDGVYVPPWMPKYVHASNEDLYDIIAYLRSSEPEVQATQAMNGETDPSLLVKFLARVAFEPMPYPEKPIQRPDTSDMVRFGRYLAVGMFGCFDCHAEDFKTMNVMEPEKSPGFFGGGNELKEINGAAVYSMNITPHKEHGIGNWTDEELRTVIREGFRPDGTALHYPMLRGKFLRDNELDAIVAYLRTLPVLPTVNKARPTYGDVSFTSPEERVYYNHGCASCHGHEGKGNGDLTKAHQKYPADSTIADLIRDPNKYWPNSLMPQWGDRIPDKDMKMLVAHVRKLGGK